MVFTLERNKCEVGRGARDVAELVRLGSGTRSWTIPAFPLVVLPKKSDNRNGNFEQRCEGKLMSKKSSLIS